jgi:anti-sigma factor ChrR (cupin superfamily)
MLNMDFSKFVSIDTTVMDWVASPKAGVWRKPLAREEAERGHATSLVKYDPGASFNSHNHPLGEEILVLKGTFSDESGDFHAGTYFRNPMGYIHSPFSKEGCVILVKLHQMSPDDLERKAIETDKAHWQECENGVKILIMHEFGTEKVQLIDIPAGAESPLHSHEGGEEIYLMRGKYTDEFGEYSAGCWTRLPDDSEHKPVFIEDSLLWIKSGHLPA